MKSNAGANAIARELSKKDDNLNERKKYIQNKSTPKYP
jgi:hypothetical protein